MLLKKNAKEALRAQLNVPQYRVEAVNAFLMQKFELKRPAQVTGQLLALIIELDKEERLFPRRKELAAAFESGDGGRRGCSVYSLDAALRVALARGLIEEETVVVESTERGTGMGVHHRRRYVPTKELLDGVEYHSQHNWSRRVGGV